jgi:GT2 family glycosyltransferase
MDNIRTVSVVIVCLNEERNIAEVLESLARQRPSRNQLEVILVDNGSTDRTIPAAQRFATVFPYFQILVNPIRGIARSRNIGWRAAHGDFVAFTDADCVVPEDWIERLLEPWEGARHASVELAAVGGGNRPPASGTVWMQALGIALNSFWGSHGSAQGMRFTKERFVPHIPTLNIMYDRNVLEELGGFDEAFVRVCEDPELNFRITSAGKKILFVPDAEVIHKARKSLKAWLKNVYLYGCGRMRLLRKHPRHFAWKFAVPPALVAWLLLTGTVAPFYPFVLVGLGLYGAIVFLVSLLLCLKNRAPTLIPPVFAILASQPFAYGAGQIAGALSPRSQPQRVPEEESVF